ncbi:hypothetical protein [Variovorax guangxiensis]|uniref:hypothetical protein n=1 Tax=Variovorax guangxiensis TaxID=1775474 RepID=UPI0028593A28|nr:hypothetical protein [Variovorax guangxiensis]MDR6861578.1 hypothetical protein [Variovorax guangxiensis]
MNDTAKARIDDISHLEATHEKFKREKSAESQPMTNVREWPSAPSQRTPCDPDELPTETFQPGRAEQRIGGRAAQAILRQIGKELIRK